MEDFKSKMIEELKRNSVLKDEKEEAPVEPKINNNEKPVSKKKPYNNRYKGKNFKKNFNQNKNNDYKKVEHIKTDFEKFKDEFFSKESVKEVIDYIEFYKEEDPTIFDKETLAKLKFEHPGMKIVMIEPNDIQEELGIQAKFWIVKPLYKNEYTNFTKTFGHREQFPDEFIDYTVKNCVVFPVLKDNEFEKISSGSVITLHHTIMEISDLNKKFKIIEV